MFECKIKINLINSICVIFLGNAGAAFQNHTRSFGSFCQPRPNVNGNVRAGPSRCGTYPTQAPTTSNVIAV